MTKPSAETIRTAVAKRYGEFAEAKLSRAEAAAGCCSPSAAGTSRCSPSTEASECTDGGTATSSWAEGLYHTQDIGKLDETIAKMTLGCGNPIAIAELQPGETVLDLGSGAGLDCFLASKQVGPEGSVIGIDMTDAMLELSRRNLDQVGAKNVEFRKGFLEDLPVDPDTVDTIISNCVINLTHDKGVVFREAFRVLKPGGRFRVSDIVWLRDPSAQEQSDLASWAGCVAGALTGEAFAAGLRDAGFTDIAIQHRQPDNPQGWTSAEILARKPR